MLELHLLGRNTISRNGEELVGISAQKQKFALIAYLALEGRATRDQLLGIFWPDREEEKARHSLSQALYSLRRELDDVCVRVEGDAVTLDVSRCAVDAKEMETAAESEEWERVVEVYRGPFLEQFALPGAPEFEKWQSITRTRLARISRRAFPRVIGDLLASDDLLGAIQIASQWANIEPLEDEAQHTLILLLARSGDRTGALELYETYRSRLARELEVEPLEGTISLVTSIRSGEIPEFRPLAAPVSEEKQAELVAQLPIPAPLVHPEQKPHGLDRLVRLGKSRVVHVGAVYLAVAFGAIEIANTLIEREVLPGWVFSVLAFFLAIGLPFALILAWSQEAPAGALRPGEAHTPPSLTRPRWAQRVRGGQVLGFLAILAVGLLISWYMLVRGLPGGAGLDSSRVIVFPFIVSPGDNETIGEDVATIVGYIVDETEELEWIDGWYLAAGITELGPDDATSLARGQRAGFYIRGRISLRGDSVRILGDLHDVENDETVARSDVSGPINEGWKQREAMLLAQQLLEALRPERPPLDMAAQIGDWQVPVQITEGERAYRRSQFAQALEHFQLALQADSTRVLAAIRGSVAASWLQRHEEAQRLIDFALRRPEFLSPRQASLAHGTWHFLAGNADSASQYLRDAVSIDPQYWEAWARLGEVYTHQLPSESPLDSLAEAAFMQVRRHDPNLSPVLFHLVEIALRKNERERADSLLIAFRTVGPDPDRLREAELMVACVNFSPGSVDWRAQVQEDPKAVYSAAQSLAVGGFQAECARAGWRALLTYDTPEDASLNRRFAAAFGLQSLLVAEGRYEDVISFLQDGELSWLAGDIYILDALAGADLEAEADAAAEQLRLGLPEDSLTSDLWLIAAWQAHRGNAAVAQEIADTIAARALRDGEEAASRLARGLAARATLAAGDSAGAIRLLRGLTAFKRPGQHLYPWEGMGGETLMLAQLLAAQGDHAGALRVAANIDAPGRITQDLIFLPTSLALRLRLARILGDTQLENRARERLTALGRNDLIN